ncbi:MAG: riboflavin biosynthesis protein RibF [Chloroflexia bacterium]|nr:riboflavin biosynthesis protein RibF [Chloroflexia bacterium]
MNDGEAGARTVQVVSDFAELPRGGHVVTIGTFDGVHRGHRFLLDHAAMRAVELGLPLLIVTFEPVPVQVLRPDLFPGRLCSRETKLALLAEGGARVIAVLPFTHAFSRLTAEEFMTHLVHTARPREVWVGEAFALGRNRDGNVPRLRAIGTELGYRLEVVSRLADETGVISSSAIRQLVQQGQPAEAARKLGRRFRIEGEVIHGAHVGRTIGFPTANIVPPPSLVALPDGIYATLAKLPGTDRLLASMTYIGTRPALNTGPRLIETHILDFDGDLYGQRVGVEFVERLRGDATFSGVDELVRQLHADEAMTRTVLGAEIAGVRGASEAAVR